jgi:CxxC-x17-CxxC domain-containing protein
LIFRKLHFLTVLFVNKNNMGNFRSDDRRGGFGRSSGGFNRGRSGGRGGYGDRDSGSFERRRPEMHDVICDQCKKECQVPFKPTGDKPVLCSDCFRKDGGASRSSNNSGSNSPGISQEQFRELNTKLDKILGILEMIEFEEEGDEESDEEDAEEPQVTN